MESIPGQHVNNVVDYLASTSIGQFFIKKIDTVFWSIEQVSKYSVEEDNKAEKNKFLPVKIEPRLPWFVFWTMLINFHIFRVVFSKILVNFNKKPIESKNIVKYIQKWRKMIRSIRYKGLQKIREEKYGIKGENGETTNESDISNTNSNKKRHYSDTLNDDDLYDQLMNQTYSETDDLDSTYVPEKDVTSGTSSSNDESPSKYDSTSKFQNNVRDTQSSEKSDTVVSHSTESAELNEVKSTDKKPDLPLSNEAAKTEETINEYNSSKNLKDGKATLNQYTDPTDVLISKLVSLNKVHKPT